MNKLKTFFSKNSNNTEETEDPEYLDALSVLNGIEIETKRTLKNIINFQKQVESLASASVMLSEDINCWFADAPMKSKSIAVADTKIIRHFDALTSNHFSQKIDSYVIAPILKFQNDLEEAHSLHKDRTNAKKCSINDHSKMESQMKKKDPTKLAEAQQRYNASQENFETINRQFIDIVHLLNNKKDSVLVQPYRSLLIIFSQYITKTTTLFEGYKDIYSLEILQKSITDHTSLPLTNQHTNSVTNPQSDETVDNASAQ